MWLAPGPEQGANESESKRHSKVELGSSAEKPKVGVGTAIVAPWAGPVSIVTAGGWESST